MIKEVIELYESNKLDEAFEILVESIKSKPEDESFHLWIGKIHFKKGEWGLAINAFNKVLEINPDNQEAKSSAEMASSIISYFTPDMFNP